MAARKQLFHPDDVKRKIQTTQLIKRLEAHALSETGDIMTRSQVGAAVALIKKTIPDLAAVQVSGEADKPMRMVIEWAKPSSE